MRGKNQILADRHTINLARERAPLKTKFQVTIALSKKLEEVC